MFPERLNRFLNATFKRYYDIKGEEVISITINGNDSNSSIPYSALGNFTYVISPPAGKKIHVIGMLLEGNGTQGECFIEREANPYMQQELLWLDISAQTRNAASSNVHIELETDETITFRTTGRGTGSKTFFGLTYTISD